MMLFKSQVYTQASGSIGGITYSHNRSGLYTRARAIPTNPASTFQQAIRTYVANSVANWLTTLTQAQRNAWETYAQNVAMTNRMGETVYLTGQQQFIRSRVPRRLAGLTEAADGPIAFTLAQLTDPTFTAAGASATTLTIGYDATDDWATDVKGALLVFASRPQSVGRNYFKGPYRFAGALIGASSAPASPYVVAAPFAMAIGQKIFVRVTATDQTGKYSADWTDDIIVTA